MTGGFFTPVGLISHKSIGSARLHCTRINEMLYPDPWFARPTIAGTGFRALFSNVGEVMSSTTSLKRVSLGLAMGGSSGSICAMLLGQKKQSSTIPPTMAVKQFRNTCLLL